MEVLTRKDEIDLILLLTRTSLSDADIGEVVRLVESRPDWDYILTQATRHRVLQLIAWNISRFNLEELDPFLLANFDTFVAALQYQRCRNEKLIGELRTVLDALGQCAHPYVLRKGMHVAASAYPEIGLRPMKDVDLLIDREHADSFDEELRDLGYVAGRPARNPLRIVPTTLREQAYWRLYTQNLPTYYKITDDAYLGILAVDLAVSLSVPDRSRNRLTRTILHGARKIGIRDLKVPACSPVHLILDIALHIYKESTTLFYLNRLKHQRLIQYCDLRQVIETHKQDCNWSELIELATEIGAETNLFYSLYHLECLYPTTVPDCVLAQLDKPERRSALEEYGASEGEPLRWELPFIDRMFTADRIFRGPVSGFKG